MTINDIRLVNFRNHTNTAIEFAPGANIILGNNGTGKTTILDAIDTLCLGRSSIARKEADIINYSTNFANISSSITTDETNMLIVLQFILDKSTHRVSKKLIINGKSRKFADLHDKITVVSFYPDDLSIITGEPTKRRKYLDTVLSKTLNHYKDTLNAYTNVVMQRNKLLESINKYNTGHMQLDYWNSKFIELGNKIIDDRLNLTDFLNSNIKGNLAKLRANLDINLVYKTQKLSSELLNSIIDKELRYKATIIGPHRDDLIVETINNKLVSTFGSRGEQRTTLLGIKLTEIDFVKHILGQKPILLLDDIFSELDQKHKDSVFDTIEHYQTIITSAENLPMKCNTINL